MRVDYNTAHTESAERFKSPLWWLGWHLHDREVHLKETWWDTDLSQPSRNPYFERAVSMYERLV